MNKKPRRPKKFRFHITAKFIADNFERCRVLDVGGGKGVLSFLLNQYGFESIVVDPTYQELPNKLRKDAYDKKEGRHLLTREQQKSIFHINDIFRPEMVQDFDLIVGLHAHGCMYHTLEQCAILDKSFALLPCCVVDEPIEKPVGINWKDYVSSLATDIHGNNAEKTNLDFVGNNLTIFKR